MSVRPLIVERTIICVDVEDFGDPRRTDSHRSEVRAGLYRALHAALTGSGVSWDDCDHEDRGDGVLALVSPEVAKDSLLATFPEKLIAALGEHNRTHDAAARIRLRLAIHSGEIQYDVHGVVGRPVDVTFRLLDAGPLRRALGGSWGVLAVITSPAFYEEAIERGSNLEAAPYRQVSVSVKEIEMNAWICLPDDPSGDHFVQLSNAPSKRVVTLPPDFGGFTGRQAELRDLIGRRVSEAGTIGIHLISGMAGVGKTTIAIHAAHRMAEWFPDGRLWVPLHGHTPGERRVAPAQALAQLLLAIGVNAQQIPTGVEARAAMWRDRVADKKLLLVLDDAAATSQVRPLLPSGPGSLVLISSRRALTEMDEAVPLSLDVMPDQDAAAMFVRRAHRPDLPLDDGGVIRLIRLCGRLPLAINLAAGRLRYKDPAVWSAERVADELEATHDRLAYLRVKTDRSPSHSTCPIEISLMSNDSCSEHWVCIPAPVSMVMLPLCSRAPVFLLLGAASKTCANTTCSTSRQPADTSSMTLSATKPACWPTPRIPVRRVPPHPAPRLLPACCDQGGESSCPQSLEWG